MPQLDITEKITLGIVIFMLATFIYSFTELVLVLAGLTVISYILGFVGEKILDRIEETQ